MSNSIGFLALRNWALALIVGVVLVCADLPAQAYIGPGAGIAFVGSLLTGLLVLLLSLCAILVWPVRALLRWLKSRRNGAAERKENVQTYNTGV
jgi:hypothetical protein